MIVSRAEPVGRYLQCFSKELENLVAESMARMAKVCYGVDLGRERLGQWLVGLVAIEFTKIEGSRTGSASKITKTKNEKVNCYTL